MMLAWAVNEIREFASTDQGKSALALGAIFGAVIVGMGACYTGNIARKLWGKYKMWKRARLSKEVCEIIEDTFVDGLSNAIEAKRVTLEQARETYARLAHLGFWGLHPRKFTKNKTPEELEALKTRLQAKRASKGTASKESTSSVMDKMLDGLDAELG